VGYGAFMGNIRIPKKFYGESLKETRHLESGKDNIKTYPDKTG
jgi:hypothetical protein